MFIELVRKINWVYMCVSVRGAHGEPSQGAMIRPTGPAVDLASFSLTGFRYGCALECTWARKGGCFTVTEAVMGRSLLITYPMKCRSLARCFWMS